MTKPKNPAAVALGKLTSPRKAESSRQNGKKGGRPRIRVSKELGDILVKASAEVDTWPEWKRSLDPQGSSKD